MTNRPSRSPGARSDALPCVRASSVVGLRRCARGSCTRGGGVGPDRRPGRGIERMVRSGGAFSLLPLLSCPQSSVSPPPLWPRLLRRRLLSIGIRLGARSGLATPPVERITLTLLNIRSPRATSFRAATGVQQQLNVLGFITCGSSTPATARAAITSSEQNQPGRSMHVLPNRRRWTASPWARNGVTSKMMRNRAKRLPVCARAKSVCHYQKNHYTRRGPPRSIAVALRRVLSRITGGLAGSLPP